MTLTLRRKWQVGDATIGELSLDGEFECFTLEDVVRPDPDPSTPEHEGKVYGETAILAGIYEVVLRKPDRAIWSPREDGKLPFLIGVVSFTGIYIHALNVAAETLGCIGVGKSRSGAAVTRSRDALRDLMAKMGEGPWTIEIIDAM